MVVGFFVGLVVFWFMNVLGSRPFRVPFIFPLLAECHVFVRDGFGPLADAMRLSNGKINGIYISKLLDFRLAPPRFRRVFSSYVLGGRVGVHATHIR